MHIYPTTIITMELPYNGRAVITDHFDHLEIIIPVKIKWILIIASGIFLFVWWFMGGWELIQTMIHQSYDSLIDKIWLLWIGIIIITSLNSLWWILAGKEIVEAGHGIISIKRQGDLFAPIKTYDLSEAKYFRSEENKSIGHWNFGRYQFNIFTKTICFEYGSKTIKFGENLSEIEGSYILKVLRDKKILTDKNFVQVT